MHSPTHTLSHTHLSSPSNVPPTLVYESNSVCIPQGHRPAALAIIWLYHSGEGKNGLYICEEKSLLVLLKRSVFLLCVHTPTRTHIHTHIQISCQTNTLKCILSQNGGLGCWGWVPLILEAGRMILAHCSMWPGSGSGCIPPSTHLEDEVLILGWHISVTLYTKQADTFETSNNATGQECKVDS